LLSTAIIADISLVIFLYMTSIFIIAQIKKDNSIVDVFWGLGFIVVAVYSLIQSGDMYDLRKMIVTLLVSIWGIRLSTHIYLRNKGKGEDFRYKAWRDTWNFFIVRSYLQIFMLQGAFMLIVSSPIWLINYESSQPLGIWDTLGLTIFGIGIFFESTGDLQLSQFKKDPANQGKIITTGLWALTRHPNYFGEALVWWGFGFYAVSLPLGWYTLLSPVIITLLLRYVSGVPMLEKKYEGRPDFEAYKKETAPFVPFVHFF
jgi:steroid 5-alpha reductase family enzyme